jgi:hypothetical protein
MASKPVSQWRLEDAVTAAGSNLPKDYSVCVKLIEHEDQWLDGSEWVGQRSLDPRTDGLLNAQRRAQYIPDDVLSEGCDNRTNGLVGQEADIQLVPLTPEGKDDQPSEAQKTFAEQTLRTLSTFWNKKGLWDVVRVALNRLHYAKRCEVVASVAEDNLVRTPNPQGQVTLALPAATDLAAALDVVELYAPPPDSAIRYTDPRSGRPVAVIVNEQDGRKQAQIWFVNPGSKQTEVRLFGTANSPSDPATGETKPSMTLDTKGRLPVAEARGSRIVTYSARRLQAQLNLATTYTSRTIEFSGSRERYFKNVEPPGMWWKVPPLNGRPLEIDSETPGGPYYKHPVPWILGADVSNNLIGLRTVETRNDGSRLEAFAEPGIDALDPVDPKFTTDGADAVQFRLYKRLKQGHLGMQKTGETSGTAYIQARAQHEADLKAVKGAVEGMLRDLLEYVLALAGIMNPASASILDNYRIEVTLKVNAGPVTADEARLAKDLRNDWVISTRECMVRCGVEDPQAMQDEIEKDPMYWSAFWGKMGQAIQAMVLQIPGLTAGGAAALLKLPPDIIKILATGEAPGFENVVPTTPTAPEVAPNRPRPRAVA